MIRFAAPNCQNCPSYHRNLLHCCSHAEIASVSEEKTSEHYDAGQVIFREGNRSAGLYCVHEGKIKLAKLGGDGKEQIIRLARSGDVLGYQELVSDTSHSLSAIALSSCTVCLIPRQVFFHHLHTNLQFSNALMQLLAYTLVQTEVRMLHLAYKPVRERLAETLLLLLHTYGTEGDSAPFTMAITREDLGALMGTTKETTTRMLSDFKQEGLLTTKGSAITITAPQQLLKIATQFD
ncbi:Crp/Fnr family transcriptional regulator [Hymenobacter sp. BRD67]|uniref:Crp/Fnr family transcriptional regulator n=1 Tax=Hymenobacter sp. BRD67 TaxID=2675877 RepID=UPI001565E7C3|nr:Crp/Fnr family transcriptional regulator [Hymenobacter sp. BRD67]QKG53951.1 Crp/Fnr family transcriptional regulator [Hymenobacter sp. BRD67]